LEVDRREAEQLDVRLRLATFEQAIELHLRGIREDGDVVPVPADDAVEHAHRR